MTQSSMFIVFPLRRQAGDLQHRSDFNSSVFSNRNTFSDLHCFVEIMRIDQVITTELLASFRKRTIRDQTLSVADAHAGRSCDRMQWPSGEILPLCAQFAGESG